MNAVVEAPRDRGRSRGDRPGQRIARRGVLRKFNSTAVGGFLTLFQNENKGLLCIFPNTIIIGAGMEDRYLRRAREREYPRCSDGTEKRISYRTPPDLMLFFAPFTHLESSESGAMAVLSLSKTAGGGPNGGVGSGRPPDLREVTAEARGFSDFSDHEAVWEADDPASGLRAIIAIHDTALGPALGGCRMWPYPSRAAAIKDALRLSKGMTLKAALAGLALGGGKAVLLGNPKTDKSETLFRAFGAVVESLRGRYITGEDVGTSVRDMDWVAKETSHVIGTTGGSGDPSPMTALGVCEGIKAAVRFKLKGESLSGLTVAVQGAGHVGYEVCKWLDGEGARLVVADVDRSRVNRAVEEFNAVAVGPETIHAQLGDVFAPCALGAVLNDGTIPELRCAIVAGAANNQLARDRYADALHRRGVLYAPDYVINAGGLISVSQELAGGGLSASTVWAKVRHIGATLLEIFTLSEAADVAPAAIADKISSERLARWREAGMVPQG